MVKIVISPEDMVHCTLPEKDTFRKDPRIYKGRISFMQVMSLRPWPTMRNFPTTTVLKIYRAIYQSQQNPRITVFLDKYFAGTGL